MRRIAALALAALVAAGAACAATTKERFSGAELRPPRAAPPLALHDAHGRRFTLTGGSARYTLVTFLYTHCPDVCPLIASNLNTALRTLGPRAKVRVLAVSVDPKGDTPAAVRAYERRMHLDARFHYLVGTRAQLLRAWRAWHVLAVVGKADVVDHVAYTALVDRKGRERVLYDAQVRERQVVHDVKLLDRLGA